MTPQLCGTMISEVGEGPWHRDVGRDRGRGLISSEQLAGLYEYCSLLDSVGILPWALSSCSSNQSAWKLSRVYVNCPKFFFFLVRLMTFYIKKELQGKVYLGCLPLFKVVKPL